MIIFLTNTTFLTLKKHVHSNYNQPEAKVHVYKCEKTCIKDYNLLLGLFELSQSPFVTKKIARSWH